MALQNSINRKTSDTRLDTIANQANPATAKYFQLNTDGTVSFVDPGAASSDPNKVDEVTFTSVTSSRALVLSDRGQFLGCNSSSAIVVTVPKDATTNFDVGSFVEIGQIGTGSVTISQEDSTINIRRYGSTAVTGHVLAGQYVAAVLKKVALNEWELFGGVDLGMGDAISVNSVAAIDANFSDSTPAPPAGATNIKWQRDTSTPNNISAYLDYGSNFLDSFRRETIAACDFHVATGTTSFDPFLGVVVSAGTINAANAGLVTRHHPGVVRFRSGTTANGGYLIGTSNASLLIGGGEVFECVANITTVTNTTIRLGFHDATSVTDAVDGAYFEITSTSVIAKTASNSTRTTSSSLFTLSTGTWYRFKIAVNAVATQVDFSVFNDSGTLQGSTSITTNIPTASGRETGVAAIATNSGTTATDLLHLDYMAYSYSTALTR